MSCVIDLTQREKQVLQMLADGKQPEDRADWHIARYLQSMGLVRLAGFRRYGPTPPYTLSLNGIRLVHSGFQTTAVTRTRAL